MIYLLDTSIVSEYIKRKPFKKVIGWLDQQDERALYISSLTIAELNKGYYKLERMADKRAEKIAAWIQKLEKRFQGRIIPVDAKILTFWAMISGHSEAAGKKLPVFDSLLAASALTHGMILVTRNVKDFENCSGSLKIVNPYSTPSS